MAYEKGPIPTSIVGDSLGFILNNSNVKIPGEMNKAAPLVMLPSLLRLRMVSN